jgi:hypothetical protein
MTFCKPDVLKPDFLKPDVLKPDVLKPDVLWVYHHYNVVIQSKQVILLFKKNFASEIFSQSHGVWLSNHALCKLGLNYFVGSF